MGAKNIIIDPRPEDIKGFHNTIKFMKFMRMYHRHRVEGIDHIPLDGKAILVINHAMVLYDIFMLWEAIYKETGRYTRTLVDRFFYKVPFLESALLRIMGLNMACWENSSKLLENNELILLSPGGMREWGKPSSQRYTINWKGRTGYAKLAIKTGTPIILAACPKADDLYDVYDNPLSRAVYKKFKAPLVFTRGWGFTNLPRPVRLTHFLSEPIVPPPCPKTDEELEEQTKIFHQHCESRMKSLLMDGIIDAVHNP